jgi:UrcA family protein
MEEGSPISGVDMTWRNAMKTLLPFAAFAAAFVAAPACAQPAATIVVRTADLDLQSPAGASALDRRIRAAVAMACGDASDADLHGRNQVARCRAETFAAAAAQRHAATALAGRTASRTFAAQ